MADLQKMYAGAAQANYGVQEAPPTPATLANLIRSVSDLASFLAGLAELSSGVSDVVCGSLPAAGHSAGPVAVPNGLIDELGSEIERARSMARVIEQNISRLSAVVK